MEGNQNMFIDDELPNEIIAQFELQRKRIEELEAKFQKTQVTDQIADFPPKYVPPHKQGNHGAGSSNPPVPSHHQTGNHYKNPNHPPHIPTQHTGMHSPLGQYFIPQYNVQYNNPMHQHQCPPIPPTYLAGFQLYPYPMDDSWRGLVPKFTGSNAITIEDHLKSFNVFIQDIDVSYEDLYIKLFMMSLLEDARDWFNSLPAFSINSLQVFQDQFLEQYGNLNALDATLHELM